KETVRKVQQDPSPIPEVQMDPNLIKVNKREPIPFVPFEMRDPITGAEITPETLIKLPNGKEATAKEYFEELNKLEKQLNEIGYSLRDRELQKQMSNTAEAVTADGLSQTRKV